MSRHAYRGYQYSGITPILGYSFLPLTERKQEKISNYTTMLKPCPVFPNIRDQKLFSLIPPLSPYRFMSSLEMAFVTYVI